MISSLSFKTHSHVTLYCCVQTMGTSEIIRKLHLLDIREDYASCFETCLSYFCFAFLYIHIWWVCIHRVLLCNIQAFKNSCHTAGLFKWTAAKWVTKTKMAKTLNVCIYLFIIILHSVILYSTVINYCCVYLWFINKWT